MVPFGGWSMPLQYSDLSALDSHLWTRENASLFDVSHMMQLKISGPTREDFIEELVVADFKELSTGSGTLSLMLNGKGGIIDDLIVTKHEDHIYVVCNAGNAEKDLKHILAKKKEFESQGKGEIVIENLSDKYGLVAIQDNMKFMTGKQVDVAGVSVHLARSGYTGEDGFEISVPADSVTAFTKQLLENNDLRLAGLAARDSLRIEAGLCLYGNDIDETTTPVEAGLVWTIGKRRRNLKNFAGSEVVMDQIKNKSGERRRVGLVILEGAPAREHAPILDSEGNAQIGMVTSGIPSPSLGKKIAMGYVKNGMNKVGSKVKVQIRKRIQTAEIVKMPFLPAKYSK
ncbi:Aminomethyltransferase, mitochondrial [Zancudomyces culisetae]|uniref:Aminomethyltransferase n=1 Tax=Zancudomyces culisetae TaxID=1213189 RepID=A0A1R1PGR0_ZANCU|nr:Aminomethyltransferase, mitochondrial [Zancudomyces culisetae]|eukprot:OMH80164.1 Aminomethyltransferase, mitochondrial [Zancudomyces culisetae]